jgi:hypothetical protein
MAYDDGSIKEATSLINELYRIVERLQKLFPGRKFTPDGHLVGSIGEVLAASRYDLDLLTMSAKGYDATKAEAQRVEIKITQGQSVAFRCEPLHLLVLSLARSGGVTEVFNGPGHLVWPHVGRLQSNGQRTIRLNTLRGLQALVSPEQRLALKETRPVHS